MTVIINKPGIRKPGIRQTVGWALLAGVVLLVMGCATSAPPVTESPQPAASEAAPLQPAPANPTTTEPVTATAPAVAPASAEADLPPVGHEVGQRVPAFTLDLADGTTVSSEELLAEGQPTFLFFFATW